MKRLLRGINRWLVLFGVDPRKTIRSMRALPGYLHDLRTLKRQRRSAARDFPFAKAYPCLGDKLGGSGTASGHYFHQDLLVARRIHRNQPRRHVDVGSRIDGFVAHVASFRAIEVIDIRPPPGRIPNVTFTQADMMAPLPESLVDLCDSLSCLHAMEHFGLGRYGDPVHYDGYLLGLDNLHRMLKKEGKLFFSVPIGPQRIEFNAHRVFSVRSVLECLQGKYRLDAFSFVDDQGDLHECVVMSDGAIEDNFGCVYGCGIFELTKL